ncbi:MAG: hypothetical protein IPG99_10765 [Ignavibacteria bacterium]|nr:hypothetical protein [Ignavibacteria bacterium]
MARITSSDHRNYFDDCHSGFFPSYKFEFRQASHQGSHRNDINAVQIFFCNVHSNACNCGADVLLWRRTQIPLDRYYDNFVAPAAPGIVKSMSKLEGNQKLGLAWFLTSILYCVILTPLCLKVIEQVFSVDLDLGFDDVLMKMLTFFLLPMLAGFLIYRFVQALLQPQRRY